MGAYRAATMALAGVVASTAVIASDAALNRADPTAIAIPLMTVGEVPGLSMAVLRDGEISSLQALGSADRQSNAAVRDDTIFEAASLSKPVVAYAFLKLVDRGDFELDQPISASVEGASLANDPRWSRITYRMLLAHTSGLPNELRPGETLAIGFDPGTRFSYSGVGYSYLQATIEQATGQQFEVAIQDLVFRPLGMADSSFTWRQDYAVRKAAGHTSTGAVNEIRKPDSAKAPSSLHTTARDYSRFLSAVLNRRGLSEPTWKAMITPQIAVQDCVVCIGKTAGPPNASVSWGLGWGLQTIRSRRMLFHWGENNGDFHAFAMAVPDSRSGMVVLTNSGNGLSIIPAITAALIPGPHPAFAWMGYDTYDSPPLVVQRQIFRKGTAEVLSQIRRSGTPALSEAQWNRIGYQLLSRNRLDDAIRVFEFNTALFPHSANVYDSLGEANMAAGRHEEAVENYKRSLALDPGNDNARRVIARLAGQQPQ